MFSTQMKSKPALLLTVCNRRLKGNDALQLLLMLTQTSTDPELMSSETVTDDCSIFTTIAAINVRQY